MIDYIQVTDNWIPLCDQIITGMLPLHQHIASYNKFTPDQAFTIGALSTAALRASGSSLLLLENRKMWDAEIIMRSTVEASLKLSYLLSQPAHFEQRYKEYAEMLYDIGLLKNHFKALAVIEGLNFIDQKSHQSIKDLLLSDDEFQALQNKYPPKIRRELESKWSFTGLIESFSNEDFPYAQSFKGLGHNYSMSSRVLHADWFGVSTILERSHREEPSCTATDMAHAARIISDVFWFSIMRLRSGYKFIGEDFRAISNELLSQFEPLQSEMGKIIETWNAIEQYTQAS